MAGASVHRGVAHDSWQGKGHVWQGSMHGRGVCDRVRGCAWQGNMHGRGACMTEGCVWQRGVHGRSGVHHWGHACQEI